MSKVSSFMEGADLGFAIRNKSIPAEILRKMRRLPRGFGKFSFHGAAFQNGRPRLSYDTPSSEYTPLFGLRTFKDAVACYSP